MKTIKKETIKGQSSKAYALVSALLTGAIAFSATGCNAEIKADGITIDKLEISGSDVDGMLDGANIQVNGSNVNIPDVTLPGSDSDESKPSDIGNANMDPAVNTPVTTKTPENQEPANTDSNKPADNTNKLSSDKTLYESFLNNKAGAGRRWDSKNNDGNETLSDLLDKLEGDEMTVAVDRNNCVSYSYIDCGNDGVPELLLNISFDRIGDAANRYYIIKEFNGKLYICYETDSWYRSYVTISDKGQVQCEGSNGSHAYFYRRGFVDGNGDYKSLFSCEKTRIEVDYSNFSYMDSSYDYHYIYWYTDGLEVPYTDWTITQFYIDDNPNYYTYSVWDSNGKDTTTDENFASTNKVVSVMNYYGLKVYDHSQLEEMIFARAEALDGLGLVSTDIDDILLNR